MEPRSRLSGSRRRTRSSIQQWWFEALDQRRIGHGERSRVALVVGVHDGTADTWIQVMAAGHPSRSVVLHVSRSTTINDALAALEGAWSDGSDDRFVIHLVPAA